MSTYDVDEEKEAENIVERVLPRLSHNNPAVILAAVKLILKCADLVKNKEQNKAIMKKMAAPLVTLLAAEPEMQYVALRNISFILQKAPSIFDSNIKVFFCKFNDPLYLKLEKIEILVKVVDDKNAESVLTELQDYS